jgi:Flp pilus assembly protein TadG
MNGWLLSRQDRPGRHRNGQGLVEFALVFPVLIFIFMLLFDFGRALYAYSTVANAAREGSRLAIVDQKTPAVQARAAGAATALGIDPGSVEVFYRPIGQTTGTCTPLDVECVAEVTVRTTWSPITPLIELPLLALMGVDHIDVSSTARMPIERLYASP